MLPFFVETFGNPSSTIHAAGKRAAAAVETARGAVAELIGASPGEIVFTSGATESNNLAIRGAALRAPQARRRILASAIEHKSVVEPCRELARHDYEFQTIPVMHDGLIDLAALVDLVDDHTAIVSVQAANNEIGTIQPIAEVAQVAHRVGAVMHCDAAQAPGRMPIDVRAWDVDLLSVSAHKVYGPKGVGALYVRGGARTAPIEPLFLGGGQERGLRAGTLNVPGIVGFGRAAESEVDRVTRLRDWFESLILERLPDTSRNGALARRLSGNSSLLLKGVDAEALIANLPDIALSTGSACTSGAPEPSHVLTAIGLTRKQAYGTVRVGIGRFTMEAELEHAARAIGAKAETIRGLGAAATGVA
jgi:cysteine desulfurase